MDVVNGKIVSTRTERSEIWNTLKPSSSVLGNKGPSNEQLNTRSSHTRGWSPSWRGSAPSPSDFTMPVHTCESSAGHGSRLPSTTTSMALEHGAGRWNRSSADISGGPPLRNVPASYGAGGLHQTSISDHHSLKSSCCGDLLFQGAVACGDCDPIRSHSYHACFERLFDKEMTVYENQVADTVSKYVLNVPLQSSRLGQGTTHEGPGGALEVQETSSKNRTVFTSSCSALEKAHDITTFKSLTENSVDSVFKQASEVQCTSGFILPATTTDLKRKRFELSADDQDNCACIEPLRFLVRKVLSSSEVGELGRIVLPKKDAEGELPHLDNKEGKLLEMRDYDTFKSWFFRYKWWLNNKSRMYVLENTGEFVREHDLKENDGLVVYEDATGKLVIRGEKSKRNSLRDLNSCTPQNPLEVTSAERILPELLVGADEEQRNAKKMAT